MTVDETIKELQDISNKGYGDSIVRHYTSLGTALYRPITLEFHKAEDNNLRYDESFKDWIEVV